MSPPERRGPRASKQSERALDWLNFLIADVETAFGPFVALYLATVGWRQGAIGSVIAISSALALMLQMPAGWLVDHLRNKRPVLAAGLVCIATASLIVVFFPSFLPMALAEALFGSAGGIFRTALAAVTIGLVGHKLLHTRTGRNLRYLALGNALTAAGMGVLAHFGSLRAPFLAAAVLCVLAARQWRCGLRLKAFCIPGMLTTSSLLFSLPNSRLIHSTRYS